MSAEDEQGDGLGDGVDECGACGHQLNDDSEHLDAECKQVWNTVFLAETCRASEKSAIGRVGVAIELADCAVEAYFQQYCGIDADATYALTEKGRASLSETT